MENPTPPFFVSKFTTEINHVWGELFLAECARLAESEPYLDSDTIEARAEEFTIQYFYLSEKEMLPYYRNHTRWREAWR